MGRKIELVKAWQASDGSLFKHCDLNLAMNYQEDINNKKIDRVNFDENFDDICKYISENHEIEEPIPFMENIPWDCDVEENPVRKCIYDFQYDSESCVYCGQPEERK